MQGIKELFKIGRGPSSSHTLAPERACKLFLEVNGTYSGYLVELYGSLSLTGKGHHTDKIIEETLGGNCKVVFKLDWDENFPNGFYIYGLDTNGNKQVKWTVFSIGGGSIQIKEHPVNYNDEVYFETSLEEIYQVCEKNHETLMEYAQRHESDIRTYLSDILDAMCGCVKRGLSEEGMLPGELQMRRSAHDLYLQGLHANMSDQRDIRLMSYAYAASEENAAGHTCVTAPTLGACGVLAAFMYYAYNDCEITREKCINALIIAGIFGNVVKTNATISGAVGGCQAEVGTAVSMTAAACAYLEGLQPSQIEYAAEIGMEHNLGLTCDPVLGYVMIPCIERNAVGVRRAVDSANLAKYLSRVRSHLVSFDMVVETMKDTGSQLPRSLRETAEGGLAKEWEK